MPRIDCVWNWNVQANFVEDREFSVQPATTLRAATLQTSQGHIHVLAKLVKATACVWLHLWLSPAPSTKSRRQSWLSCMAEASGFDVDQDITNRRDLLPHL